MIKLLADFFRGFSMIMGVSSPAEDMDDRKYVLMWSGIFAGAGLVAALLLYLIVFVVFPQTARTH